MNKIIRPMSGSSPYQRLISGSIKGLEVMVASNAERLSVGQEIFVSITPLRGADGDGKTNGEKVKSQESTATSEAHKYLLIVTDNPNLVRGAEYLREDLKGDRRITDIAEIGGIEEAIEFWLANPFNTPLIVADMRTPASVGQRLNYLRSQIDPEVSTAVVNPYNVRDSEGNNVATDSIERQAFIRTIKIELADMARIRRAGVDSLRFEAKKEVSAANRVTMARRLIEQHRDYIIGGSLSAFPERARRVQSLFDRPEYYIMEMMRHIEPNDPNKQDNALLGELAAMLEERVGLGTRTAGAIVFGEESLGGPYTIDQIDQRALLEGKSIRILGYKPVRTFEEAKERKKATDWHIQQGKENQRKASLEDDVGRLWSSAMLNPPEVEGALPANSHGRVGEHGAVISVYKGLGLGQTMLPEMNRQIDEGNALAARLRTETLEIIMERFGFWRAYPFTEVKGIPDTQQYYPQKEVRFVRLINDVFNLGLKEEDLADIEGYLAHVNSRLVIDPSDLGLRMDMKWYNFGYAVEGHPQPTIKDVIEATSVADVVNKLKLREILVNYDLDGIQVLVPRYHDFSHIETDPKSRFASGEAQIYLDAGILNEHMFTALRNSEFPRAVEISKQVTALTGGHLKPGDVPELRQYEEQIASKNRPITNFYRCTEEAEQTLWTRLPRFLARLEDAKTHMQDQEAHTKLERDLSLHTDNFWEYVRRATEWHNILGEGIGRGARVRRGYELLTNVLQTLTPREIPEGKIMKLWDGL